MIRVVVCLDKLKGSLTAVQACAAVAAGITAARPDVEVLTRPVADGGEGTVDALVAAGWTRHPVRVTGPLGVPVDADLAVRGHRAVVEMAQASGLDRLGCAPSPDTAWRSSTTGTGELVAAALALGCTEVVLAVGGSASTDGGAGMLVALGARVHGDGRVDLTGLDPRLAATTVVLASDVENPLLGPDGAAAVYGPQKGAGPADVARLETRLRAWAAALPDGLAHAGTPGAGAAGGTGFGALVALGATRTSGADLVLSETRLADAIDGAALVVVGEGRLDAQSLQGKAPVRVAALAGARGVPVVAVAGAVTVDDAALRSVGISRHHQLVDHAVDTDDAVTRATELLHHVGGLVAAGLTPG